MWAALANIGLVAAMVLLCLITSVSTLSTLLDRSLNLLPSTNLAKVAHLTVPRATIIIKWKVATQFSPTSPKSSPVLPNYIPNIRDEATTEKPVGMVEF